MKVFPIVLCCFALITNGQFVFGVEQKPEVQPILDEISQLLLDHYNVNVEKMAKRPQPTAEQLEEAELDDDIIFTEEQALNILNGMKKEWGLPYSENRVLPNSSYYWEMPIRYYFEDGNYSKLNLKYTVELVVTLNQNS